MMDGSGQHPTRGSAPARSSTPAPAPAPPDAGPERAAAAEPDDDPGIDAGAERVRLRPLTLVDEGDDVLVGDPASGTFVAVPQVGAVVIRALQRGATLREAAAEAEREAGEPVDVSDFVDGLRELGFVEAGGAGGTGGIGATGGTSATDPTREPGETASETGEAEVRRGGDGGGDGVSTAVPVRTAPIQQRRWVTALRPELARPLFSPVAWGVYAAALVFSVACFALRPDLWPRAQDVFSLDDAGLSILVALPFNYLLAGVHEAWHWLAARSLGLAARFGVDRRMYFLAFETDLSQIWTVPRRRRYGPQLAGLAIDSFVLAVLLCVELLASAGVLSPPPLVARLVAALVFLKVVGMLLQCLVFLRTDLYGVLVTATGCRNLWRVKSLMLRRAFGRLTGEEAEELAAADPRDLRVGRWFRWVYLAGFVAALAYFGYFYVPVLARLLAWTADGLAAGPATARFWLTAAGSLVLYLPLLTALFLWLGGLRRGRDNRRRPAAGASP